MVMMRWQEVIRFLLAGLKIDGVANRTLTVGRTGYWEKDLVDPKVDNLKFDAALAL